MLKKGLLAIAVALALPAIAVGQGTTREIGVVDDEFIPENVSTTVGVESFRWAWGPPASVREHNVRQDDKLFYSGTPAASGEFTVTPSAGTFGYYCEIHGNAGIGMHGELRVKPTGSANGNRASIVWATAETNSGSQFDVRQKVGTAKPKLVEEKTREFEGSFKLKPGKNQFQVRSRRGKATSDWSPKLSFKG